MCSSRSEGIVTSRTQISNLREYGKGEMSALDQRRIGTAYELRKRAEGYRHLARFIGDERALGIIHRLSRELDETAGEIEREILERTETSTEHAA